MREQKTTFGFWITVAIVSALILYPLSFGPACWIKQRTRVGHDLMWIAYRPMWWTIQKDIASFSGPLTRYAEFGTRDSARLHVEEDGFEWFLSIRMTF